MRSRHLLNAEHADKGTREYALAQFAAKANWNLISDSMPSLKNVLGPSSMTIFEEFLACCEQRNLALDWKRHIHLFQWMSSVKNFDKSRLSDIRLDFLAASAGAWACDMYANMGAIRMILIDTHANLAVGAIRPQQFPEQFRVHQLQIANAKAITGLEQADFGFGLSTTDNGWNVSCWNLL